MFISVVVPAHNVEKYISKTLKSLEAQTFKNFEVIIVNDGSTDQTKMIAGRFCKKNTNFSLINQSNQGVAIARKNGLLKAKGKFIYFCDADDYIHKDTFKKATDEINNHNLDALMINAKFKNDMPENEWGVEHDKKLVVSANLPNRIISGPELLKLMIKNREWRYAVWLYFVKKEIILPENITYENMIHEDAAYNFEMLSLVTKIKFINAPFYNYRIRSNSIMSSNVSSKNVISYINAFSIINNCIKMRFNNNQKEYFPFEKRILDQIIESYCMLTKIEKKKCYSAIYLLKTILKKRHYYFSLRYFLKFFLIKLHKEKNENGFWAKFKRNITRRIKKNKINFLEMHIVEHCNLKCKGCCHFSPLCEEEFLDIKEFETDLNRLSNLVNGKIDRFILLGGEPLLHPDVESFLITAKKILPKTSIELVTNCILLPKMKESFWTTCKENDICINLTLYPIIKNKNEIINLINKYQVRHYYYADSDISEKQMVHYFFDKNGRKNKNKNFYRDCFMANCNFLSHGKIYPCAVASCIKHYNNYFKEEFIQSEQDYINIYKIKKADELYKFLTKPIPFCRYCDREDKNLVKWEISKKNKNEW